VASKEGNPGILLATKSKDHKELRKERPEFAQIVFVFSMPSSLCSMCSMWLENDPLFVATHSQESP
jgi:hypothetical protein